MGLWKSFKGLFKEQATTKSNYVGKGYDFTQWQGANFFGSKNEILRRNEEIFSIVTRLANTLSSLPVHLYRNYEQITNNISELVEQEANPSMSAFQTLNQLEVSRNTNGNGYLFIERDAMGAPINLWAIDPSTVTVKRNIDDNSIWYEVHSEEYNFLVFNTEMIHVKHISPLTGVLGISPIDVLQNTLKFSKAVEDFSLNEMKKKDSFVIKYDRSMDVPKREALIKDFVNMINNHGGAVVQEKGFEYERWQNAFQAGELSATEGITRTKIANAFNVPLSFLNDGQTKSTASTAENVMTQFVQMTLLPIVKQYEAELNRKLLTQNQRHRGYYFKFNVNGLMRGDTSARTQFYQMMIRNGIATPNDLRRLEELPPSKDKEADQLLITGDLYPLNLPISERTKHGTNARSDNQPDLEHNSDNQPDVASQPTKGGDSIGQNQNE